MRKIHKCVKNLLSLTISSFAKIRQNNHPLQNHKTIYLNPLNLSLLLLIITCLYPLFNPYIPIIFLHKYRRFSGISKNIVTISRGQCNFLYSDFV